MTTALFLLFGIAAVVLTSSWLALSADRSLERLREQAVRIDSEFATRQFEKERVLSGIRYRIAYDKAENMLALDMSSSAPGMCPECLDGTHDRRPS